MSTLPCLALAALLLPSPAALADDDAAIAALLERMEAAVLKADTDAYLACIDRTEPEWAREQINWAADLSAHTPEAFDLTLTSELTADPPAETSDLTADLRISWRLPDARERHVRFPARFTHAEGDMWLFAGEDWSTMSSADSQNVVLYLDDSLDEVAARVIQVMPEIREHVDEGFETSLDRPQVIKLYTNMTHLQESIYLSYTDPLGGWNEPGEAIKIIADPRMGARGLRTLLAHEYGHVATFTYSPDASNNMPWWVAEGVAELAAERYTGRRAREAVNEIVQAWAKAGTLADWRDMADFRTTPANLQGHVYTQGHQFLGYLSERFDRPTRNRWLRLLAAGVEIDQASQEALGMGFDELDTQWRASLRPADTDTDDG